MFAGKKSAQKREILISESAWEEMTCLFAPSIAIDRQRQLFVTGGLNECSNEIQNFRPCNSRQNREVRNPYSVTSPSWRI
ncbi:hypothetical protein EXX72_01030 [Escherichia coli]|nr:hypothetical protein EXX72_01030 [Escherichia coli]